MDLLEQLAKAAPVEEHISFTNKGQVIHGMLRLPEGNRPFSAAIVAHGFTGSRNADARMLVWISRALAHNGIASISFDFRGSGESEGHFSDMTPEEEVSDARTALDFLQADSRIDSERLGMGGHSLGGMVTALTAAADPRLKAIALWAAVGDSEDSFKPRLEALEEKNRCGIDKCEVGGLLVGKKLYADCAGLDLQQEFRKSFCPALIIHGDNDQTVPVTHADLYEKSCSKTDRIHRKIIIKNADHCFNGVEWRKELVTATVEWFKNNL